MNQKNKEATGIIEKELAYEIVNAAYEVHNVLGPGFLESIYEEGMAIELSARGHRVERQARIAVIYKDRKIGEHVLDLVIDNRIILEIKAVTDIAPIHKQQALSYLKSTGYQLAIVINFGATRVQTTRVVLTNKS
jgi:GxxExxY protein